MAKRRVLLKLSGEAFADPLVGYGIDPDTVQRVAKEVAEASNAGIEIAIVVGGGNIFRGVSQQAKGMDPANADYMGMLATVINALALRDALEHAGAVTRVQSAITMQQLAEPSRDEEELARHEGAPGEAPAGASIAAPAEEHLRGVEDLRVGGRDLRAGI